MTLKSRLILIYIILISSISNLYSQELSNSDSLSVEKEKTFEEYFYLAISKRIKRENNKAIELLNKAIRLNPASAEAQYELAINYKALNDVSRAILFGENAVRLDKSKIKYWYELSNLYSLVNDSDNVERCFKNMAQLDSKFKLNYYSILAKNEKFDLAIQLLKGELEQTKDEESIDFITLLRDIYVFKKDFKNGISYTERLIELHPDDSKYIIELSDIYIKESKERKARSIIKKALKKDEENENLKAQLFKINMLSKKYKDAFKTVESVMLDSIYDFNSKLTYLVLFVESDVDHENTNYLIGLVKKWLSISKDNRVYPILGNLYNVNKEQYKALAVFREGLENGMNDQNSLSELLFIEYEKGRINWLLEDSKKVIDIIPSLSVAYYLRGFALQSKSLYSESIFYLEKGVELAEDQKNTQLVSEFYSLLAEAYYRLGDFDKAFLSFDKSLLNSSSENYTLLNNYAYYLAEQNRDLDKALSLIEQVAKQFPDDANYQDTYAWVLFKMGELDKSKEIFKTLYERYPNDLNFTLHYSDVLFAKKDFDLLSTILEKALNLHPNNEAIKKRINEIKK